MLGQRLSNEQSNVGPTKYVAVGPTLNQRLGFGWRMVSVLAGVAMAIRKLTTGKSSGLDGIYAEHLLHCSQRFVTMLAMCFT